MCLRWGDGDKGLVYSGDHGYRLTWLVRVSGSRGCEELG